MNTVLLTQLKILKMSDIKPNFSELARLYEMDRRTIKKYYEGYEGKPKNRYKTSKLDKYKELIGIKLAIKGVNVRSFYEYLISEIDSDIGTYSNFNKYVKKEGLKPSKTPKGFPRYETSPGIQAQVDWKEDISIKNKFGKIFTFHVFSYKGMQQLVLKYRLSPRILTLKSNDVSHIILSLRVRLKLQINSLLGYYHMKASLKQKKT